MRKYLVAAGALLAGTALAAQGAGTFSFSPTPRWQAEPEIEALCEAMRRECPDMAALPEIATSVEYDELYDADGRLAGLRMTRGTGCAPYDESILLGQREFRTSFQRPGVPDLDEITLEVGPGIDRNAVRMVKHVESSTGMGCPQQE